ncbi:hypothetical protein GGR56DRAFT_676478 [Xylariaceae sp. FL0804]|nr:hypothetical protein GGR56DRAFT_676478 [Xylariaceae sp. FL0804]
MDVHAGPSASPPHSHFGVGPEPVPLLHSAAAAAVADYSKFLDRTSSSPSASASSHHAPPPRQRLPVEHLLDHAAAAGTSKMLKRKAESQDNERLSKRLSLLNIEQSGTKLYVPVESPQPQQQPTPASAPAALSNGASTAAPTPSPAAIPIAIPSAAPTSSSAINGSGAGSVSISHDDDVMQLDDTRHKVYVYDLDDELSSAPSSPSSSDDELSSSSSSGRLVYLPDIARHMMRRRGHLPPLLPSLNPNPSPADDMQLVLYREPASLLSVPPDRDPVRRAVAEAREQARAAKSYSGGDDAARAEQEDLAMAAAAPSWPASGDGGVDDDDGDDPDAMEVD